MRRTMELRLVLLHCIGIALLMVFPMPSTCLPRPEDSGEDSSEPAPVYEEPVGTPVTRAPCEVRSYSPREGEDGVQYTDTTEQIKSATAKIMAPIIPGNYSYSGSYQPDDPCNYE